MKTEQLYQQLIELAEKLEITVSEQNLKPAAGVNVNSGLCVLRGKRLFIMDKHASVHKKLNLLADCLCTMPHEDLFLIPAVREMLSKKVALHKKQKQLSIPLGEDDHRS